MIAVGGRRGKPSALKHDVSSSGMQGRPVPQSESGPEVDVQPPTAFGPDSFGGIDPDKTI
jgi:hypothetical protein